MDADVAAQMETSERTGTSALAPAQAQPRPGAAAPDAPADGGSAVGATTPISPSRPRLRPQAYPVGRRLPGLPKAGATARWLAAATGVQTALEALLANRLRSLLTMLGIIIGVGAVIAVVALGQGAKGMVTQQLARLGTNMVTIQPGSATQGGVATGLGGRPTLTAADVQTLQDNVAHIAAISPVVGGQAQVIAAGKNWNTRVQGVFPAYASIGAYEASEGAFFTQDDEDSAAAVAVIGQTVAINLFPDGQDPVGQQVRIRNVVFQVVGVLATKGNNGFQDQDDLVLIPFSAAQRRLFGSANVQQIQLQVDQTQNTPAAISQSTAMLEQTHRIPASGADDFTVRNLQAVQQAGEQAATTITTLLTAVAAVSLVVGGIGIMNIMLVSVTERTREIGIRLAVGARGRDVHLQFLVEAVTLSVVGGLIGIAGGTGGSVLLSRLSGWPTVVPLWAVGMAAGFAMAVGVIFGWYPAAKAAGMDPIEALRQE